MPENGYRHIKRTLKILSLLTAHPKSTSRELYNGGKPWDRINGNGDITYKGFRQFIHRLLITRIVTTVEDRKDTTSQGNLFYAYQYISKWYVRPHTNFNFYDTTTVFTNITGAEPIFNYFTITKEDWESAKDKFKDMGMD